MSQTVTTILLPGGDASRLGETLDSIRGELGADGAVLGLPGGDLDATLLAEAGLTTATPDTVADAGGILSFARPGDRLLPGAMEIRLLTFENFPAAAISIAGHVLTGPDGKTVREVKPPTPGSAPDEMLIWRTIEPAAVILRTPALPPEHLDLLGRPLADVVVGSRIAREGGYQVSGEAAAMVPLDPDRHGQSGIARVGSLAEAVGTTSGPDEPGESTMRRELFRRLFLAPEGQDQAIDLARLFEGKLGSPEGAAAVISDLQWIAERQSEALELERVRWADGELREKDATPLTVSEEIVEAQARLGEVGARMAQLDNTVRRLEAEIYRRDSIISDLQGVPLHEARGIAEEEAK